MKSYDRLRTAREALPGTRTGSDEDRFAGLQRLASATAGGTILDIGCNDGIVDTFFAQHHAARCVGLDFYRPGRQILPADVRRLVHDLVSRAARYFAIRAPASQIEDLAPDLRDRGLERWYDDHLAAPRVNPPAVFERSTGGA